jgi:dimethylargininase
VTPGVALVRRPSRRLAEGIVTHVDRRPVDVALAERQHEAYRAALAGVGWTVTDVPVADEHPDSVFVEDTVVVCDGVALLTHPGAEARRGEVAVTEAVVRGLGLDVARVEPPGTLDGGDVLQVGRTVYVGIGGRTNEAGVAQLRDHLAKLGRDVVAVRLGGVLHLKSAVTALPDETLLALPHLFDTRAMPAVHPVTEEAGCHVVPLGGDDVLIAASAPKTADWLGSLGYRPVVVDIGEFEKLEGCVTCLCVLISQEDSPR